MAYRSRTTDPTTDEVARDRTDRLYGDVADLRRELDEVDDRVASVLVELREHRTASAGQHAETQRSLAALSTRLDALGGGQGGPGGSGAAGAPPGGVLAAVPAHVWGGAGTLLAALLAGLAMAMGWAAPKPPPSPAAPPAEVAGDGPGPTP